MSRAHSQVRARKGDDLEPDERLERDFKARFPYLWSAIHQADYSPSGGRVGTSYRVFRWRRRWMVVVKTHDLFSGALCAFGRGDTVFQALRAVNTAIQKGRWSSDKFGGDLTGPDTADGGPA
jgi:hypothetical protein